MKDSWTSNERKALDALVTLALAEDLGPGDVTARALVPPAARASARFVLKAPGVVAGLAAAEAVFRAADPTVVFEATARDGDRAAPGAVLARVSGSATALLAAERTALNFLQRLSGVATLTRRFVDAVAGTKAEILDTRKTHPGFRLLDKYAVRCGGGRNHRLGLYDEVLIKENHLSGAGLSPGEGVRRARERAPEGTPVEVEVETLDQFRDALAAGPDVIMLDDMTADAVRAAVALRGPSPPPRVEVSGGVTLDTVRQIAALGVDRISVGALTHSAPALDISLRFDEAP